MKKKTHILSTLLAVTLAAGLLLVSCPIIDGDDEEEDGNNNGINNSDNSGGNNSDNSGGNNGGNSGGNNGGISGGTITNGGNTLTLSGQVYTMETNYNSNDMPTSVSFSAYTGPDINGFKTFIRYGGYEGEGTGSIRNKQLSFTIGIPGNLGSFVSSGGSGPLSDMSVSPSDTKVFSFSDGLTSYDDDGRYYLERENTVLTSSTSTTFSYTQERVSYMYVDKACTITATGGTETEDGFSATYSNVNLSLNKGWNAVTQKMTVTNLNYESETGDFTVSQTVGDPSTCKWVLRSHSYGYGEGSGGSSGGESGGGSNGGESGGSSGGPPSPQIIGNRAAWSTGK